MSYENFAEGFLARVQHGPPMRTGRFVIRFAASLVLLVAVVALVWVTR